jgi:hypothetical protein
MVTANRLHDGAVVYLDAGRDWCEVIGGGCVAASKQEAEALLRDADRAVAERRVVNPYLIEVASDAAGVRPLRYREFIRAQGPSVRLDLGKQAVHG